LILQLLNNEPTCESFYHKEKIEKIEIDKIKEYSFAWNHHSILEDTNFTYLSVLAGQQPLIDFAECRESYREMQDKVTAHKKAALAAKICLEDFCFYDLIPEHLLKKWLNIQRTCFERIRNVKTRQQDYEILHKAHVLTRNIAEQKISYGERIGKVKYNIFGSQTGRLTTKKGSVPVLTLKKEQRFLLKPQNDAFVELDLNAAEIRMLMALNGKPQPKGDIHQHLKKEIFGESTKRSEFKERLFAWLYNPNSDDTVFDSFFSRETFRDFFVAEEKVLTTPFGRRLAVDERKAQNYLLQSTTSDQVLENAYKIQKILKGKKSTIAFTLHDSIVLDMSQEDAIMIRDIKEQFEKTKWGNFMSTCKIGKNFGDLKELKV